MKKFLGYIFLLLICLSSFAFSGYTVWFVHNGGVIEWYHIGNILLSMAFLLTLFYLLIQPAYDTFREIKAGFREVKFSSEREKMLTIVGCILFGLICVFSVLFSFLTVLFLTIGEGTREWYHFANFGLSAVLLGILIYFSVKKD